MTPYAVSLKPAVSRPERVKELANLLACAMVNTADEIPERDRPHRRKNYPQL